MDDDSVCHKLLNHYFPRQHSEREGWLKFDEFFKWATTNHKSRGGIKMVKKWTSAGTGASTGFAFGFEYPRPFGTIGDSKDGKKRVKAAQDAKKQGVYNGSKFNKFENHRRTVYIHVTRMPGKTERTVIINQNRPSHISRDECKPIPMTEHSVWKGMFQDTKFESEEHPHKEDLETVRVLKNVLAGVISEVLDTWIMEITRYSRRRPSGRC
jgi:hypothetical protein